MPTLDRINPSLSSPLLDVVFLHGLDGDPVKTWSSLAPSSFWPEWLAEDNPQAAVWCVGFDAWSSRWRGPAMGILDRSISLLSLLTASELGSRPLCFIGHSLGGLVAKQMLLTATTTQEYRTFAIRTKAVVFLATPHDGASIATVAKMLRVLRPTELLGDLANRAFALRQLNNWYRDWAKGQGVEHLVFVETIPTHGNLIVSRASADPGLDVTPVPIDANHVGVCKPIGREEQVYIRINRMVAGLVGPPATNLLPQYIAPQDVGPAETVDTLKLVFQGTGWKDTLRSLYPRFELLEFEGATFPIWAKAAPRNDWDDLDAGLGGLSPGQDPRQYGYPEDFDPNGATLYRERLECVDQTTSFNGATYALDNIEIGNNKLRLHAKHGTYFHSLATSEILETELICQLAADPRRKVGIDRLPRRKWLHEIAGDQRVVLDGRRRSAALSVAATVLMAETDGTYSALLARRSDRVRTHRQLYHVAPAGIFAPINAEGRDVDREFSIRNCVLREYAEELFGYKELEQGDGVLAKDVSAIPPIQELRNAERNGMVVLRYCGISVPLLTLRPEICVLIFIRDPGWFDRQIKLANETDHWFALNWEYEQNWKADNQRLRFDRSLCATDRTLVDPSTMVPHAAAALSLSISVARHILDSEEHG